MEAVQASTEAGVEVSGLEGIHSEYNGEYFPDTSRGPDEKAHCEKEGYLTPFKQKGGKGTLASGHGGGNREKWYLTENYRTEYLYFCFAGPAAPPVSATWQAAIWEAGKGSGGRKVPSLKLARTQRTLLAAAAEAKAKREAGEKAKREAEFQARIDELKRAADAADAAGEAAAKAAAAQLKEMHAQAVQRAAQLTTMRARHDAELADTRSEGLAVAERRVRDEVQAAQAQWAAVAAAAQREVKEKTERELERLEEEKKRLEAQKVALLADADKCRSEKDKAEADGSAQREDPQRRCRRRGGGETASGAGGGAG